MGIKEVKKEILDTAKSNADKIIHEAEKERIGILKSAESQYKSMQEQADKELRKVVESISIRETAEANSIIKKQKLALERDMIQEVLNDAQQKLETFDKGKRDRHLKRILKSSFKYTKVYCAKKDMPLLKGYKPNEAKIIGGAILENKEGDIRMDLSYETLLSNVKETHLSDIAKILQG